VAMTLTVSAIFLDRRPVGATLSSTERIFRWIIT
jgi:hypothetical protein